jgi:hypothetical protein
MSSVLINFSIAVFSVIFLGARFCSLVKSTFKSFKYLYPPELGRWKLLTQSPCVCDVSVCGFYPEDAKGWLSSLVTPETPKSRHLLLPLPAPALNSLPSGSCPQTAYPACAAGSPVLADPSCRSPPPRTSHPLHEFVSPNQKSTSKSCQPHL